jgi:actin cytoskeleton-regulatory complex protein END3
LKSIPGTLPDWLVPSSKAHLAQAQRALSGSQPAFAQPDIDSDSDTPGLKNNFDWYMSPKDKGKYEEIYSANADSHGDITFDSLDALYASLDVPDTDIRSAWNLVNPKSAPAIGKDACLAFLHVLNGRHEGFRLPRTVPPSLRASFERNQIDYQVDHVKTPAQKWGASGVEHNPDSRAGRKAKFGEAYLSRLGLGGGTNYTPSGTDFNSATTPDWEEVRLKKELQQLEEKVEAIERRAEEKRRRRQGGSRDTKPALVKRELEQLLDYKRRELRELELGEGKSKEGANLKATREEIESVKEQVEGLERHWKERQSVLQDLRDEIDAEKR